MIQKLLLSLVIVASGFALPSNAEAGPLLDWLRGCRKPRCNQRCNPCMTPTVTAGYAPNACGLQPGQCMRTCNKVCTRTVVNYVPCTSYRTSWQRVPVTQYRPVTNTDPCTGCTVTCMRPCTSYSWQMKRVPYTTYRPVYRQENYSVPVTTITNDCNPCATGACATGTCATGACPTGTCATCPTAMQTPAMATPSVMTPSSNNVSGTYYTDESGAVVSPPGTISTGGGYQSAPADTSPSLDVNPQSMQRSAVDQMRSVSETQAPQYWPRLNAPATTPSSEWNNRPAVINVQNQTAQSPVRKRWAYSPVRLASYSSTATAPAAVEQGEVRGTFEPVTQPGRPVAKPATSAANAGWETVN